MNRFLVLSALIILSPLGALAQQAQFSDDFSAYPAGGCLPEGSHFGAWTVVFTGSGCVKIEGEEGSKFLHMDAYQSSVSSETYAVLVSGPNFAAPLTLASRLNTVAQVRLGSPANTWEVGWLAWGFTDNEHFYYFIPKPNGWELGKRDPAYPGGQRFLATGTSPTFPIGAWTAIKITQDAANTISVYADGRLLTAFSDTERPYLSGKIALYNEDVHAHFDEISIAVGVAPEAVAP